MNAKKVGLIDDNNKDVTTLDKVIVSIVPCDGVLSKMAYDSNPLEKSIGQTVACTNNDYSELLGNIYTSKVFDSRLIPRKVCQE